MDRVDPDTHRIELPRRAQPGGRIRGLASAWTLLAACAMLTSSPALAQQPFPGMPEQSSPVPPRRERLDAGAESSSRERHSSGDPSLHAISPNASQSPPEFSLETLLQQPLADVLVEGNTTIRTDAILRKIQARPGRIVSSRTIQQDVTQLLNTRWFFSVQPNYRSTQQGPVLVFKVVERPIIRSVTFKGNDKIKTGELQAHTGLRANGAFDVAANRESVHRIKQLYREKGYHFAEVTLEEGDSPDDRDIVFLIDEGPKVKIWDINFEGNQAFSDAILRTKIESKTVKLWIIQGDYDPEIIRNDELALKQYYMSLGYFDVLVESKVSFSDDKAKVTLDFHIDEGPRYRVAQIDVVGNDVFSRDQLLNGLSLEPGEFFNERFLKEDVASMTEMYDECGRLFAKVVPTPRYRQGDEPIVDLLYQIDEDVPRYIGTINVHIRGDYPHSQEEVVREQVGRFLKPGQLARNSDLRMARARVMGSGIWDKQDAPAFDIVPNDGSDYWPQTLARGQDYSRSSLIETSEVIETHTPESQFGHSLAPIDFATMKPTGSQAPVEQLPQPAPPAERPIDHPVRRETSSLPNAMRPMPRNIRAEQPTAGVNGADLRGTAPKTRLQSGARVMPDPDLVFQNDSETVFRAQNAPPMYYRSQSLDAYGLPVPQDYLQGDSPAGDPFGDALSQPAPGFVDVNIDVSEGRTGRLMFGVGVNSNSGLVGSLVLQEDNFDLLRPPTSWADIINGTAWRGAGQSFRLEAVPGTQVSRYMASWQDPYFLRTNFNLGVSGFYYNRYFQYWTEDRLGGRVSLGYVLDRYWSISSALRLENVHIGDIPAAAPTDLTSVKGDNFLSTGQLTLSYDARDNSFFPTRGNFFDASYEQAFGEFNYPQLELTGGQFFTTYERPDGFGKHILSLTGQIGWSGNDTPIFERFYAGGYSSFRGFYYRGVSPIDTATNVKVGGNFMLLGSAEYMIPITATDNIRTVVFSDFGTIEPEVGLDSFRVTAGFGFRLVIPAMGPAPLAFDFAWPIVREDYDRTRVFSFYIGFSR